jgi:hypothetical protein
MKFRYITIAAIILGTGCTKLGPKLNDSVPLPPSESGGDVTGLLNSSYNSMNGLMHAQDQLFSLQETTTDEALIPVRGGDWDDNGVWRVLHAHTWTPIHGQFKSVFNGLGAIQSSAVTVLAFNPSPAQRAEALFLKTLSMFYYLDLWGQVPVRSESDYNSIEPSEVLQPADAISQMVANLEEIIPVLPASNAPYKASPDAARFLLMKVLLNKGAWLNREAPSFDNGDMTRVIELGNQIIDGGVYSLTPNYFDNFGPTNATTSTEMIFGWPNTGSANDASGRSSGGINSRWMMTLHYNSYKNEAPNAGWNGFTSLADFYNTFEAGDSRAGGTDYPGVTDVSGLKVGFLVGVQKNADGTNMKDRQGNDLAFTPDVKLIETDKNRLEVAGIRVIKYPPDYNAYSGGNQTNQLQIFRYADVVLMVAEAKARSGDDGGALTMVNELRATRGAAPLGSLTLVNESNVNDPNTLLSERGRELYWESWRRQDLIRFGVYLKPWGLKEADPDSRNLLYPIAPDELLANPNLVQNPGY